MNRRRMLSLITAGIFSFTAFQYPEQKFRAEETETFSASCIQTELSPALTRSEAESLPEKFDLREEGLVSAVKSQGNYGTCWTFAASGALETALIKQNPFIDLSELHLAYFSFCGENTPESPEKDPERFISGGHISYAAASYARWTGPVSESVLPYDTAEEDIDLSLQNSSEYFVTDINVLNQYSIKDTEPDEIIRFSDNEIKQMLLDENAVTVNIRYDNTCNMETYAQFDSTGGKINHGVLIVGWDDSYSRENFLVTPPGDGAWIVKNSWGDDWGLDGYFYVSYYDKSLSDACCLSAEPTGRYETNYQHDTLFYTAAVSPDKADRNTGYMANVFTADRDDWITGTGFYTTDNNAEYEITVYTDLKNPSDPTSGTPGLTLKGTEKYAGYHTYNLTEAGAYAHVNAGDIFAVVVKLTNPGYSSPIPVEASVILMENRFANNVSGISEDEIEENSEKGQSFISSNGTRWTDTKGMEIEEVYDNIKMPDTNIMYYVGNVCLKAFGSQNINSFPEETGYEDDGLPVISSLTVNGKPVSVCDDKGKPVTELYSEIAGTSETAVIYPIGTAEITVNGKTVISGHQSEEIPLEYGENIITVSAEKSGKKRDYTLKVIRNRAAVDYYSETIVFDEETVTVKNSEGHVFSDGDSISDRLGQTLTVTEADREYELEVTARKNLSEILGENALSMSSETVNGLFSFKNDVYFSTSPDMSDPQDINIRSVDMLSETAFRIYPGDDTDLYFQVAAGDTDPVSDIYHVYVPARPEISENDIDISITGDTSFSFTLNTGGRRADYKAEIKYSNDPPSSSVMYYAKTVKEETTVVEDLVPGQTYSLFVKIYSDKTRFATDIAEFIVKMPDSSGNSSICSFNYEKERIIFDDTVYSVKACDGTEIRCYDIISEYTGTDMVFTDAEGNTETVSIPERRQGPETTTDYSAGRLTGTFDSSIVFNVNYSHTYDSTPNKSAVLADRNGVITLDSIFSSNWNSGDTINFFYAATENEFASEVTKITIPSQDSISRYMLNILSYTDTEIILEAHEGLEYGYRTDFTDDFTWQDSPVLSGLKPGRQYILAVRYKSSGDKSFSRSAYATITTLSEKYTAGDLNGDSQLNASDVIIFKRLILLDVKPDAFQKRGADMNSDGNVSVLDFQRLLFKISGY